MDSEVPFLRKQRDGRGLNPGVRGVNRLATHTSTEEHQPNFKHMGEPNKAKGNSKTPASCIFILLNGTYQDCSFLLLISYYIIISSSSGSTINSSLE